ncbi:MAG TPA: hypothetical protein VM934_12695 [Pyrinomonadaceae bacterium]|nr:hypothetical protein [Pyrinomonadaceae bacterium]
MLFIESRIADAAIDAPARIALLDALQDRGLVALIRSARLYCFEQALSGTAARAGELERIVSAWADKDGDAALVRGDIFCSDDFAHFLIFGDADEASPLRAGIIYGADTIEPAQKLEAFCRSVREALEESLLKAKTPATAAEGSLPPLVEWRVRGEQSSERLARFAGIERGAGAGATQSGGYAAQTAGRTRVVEILEDAGARQFLQRLNEAHAVGRVAERPSGGGAAHDAERESMVARLAGAGLVRREVLVSCRKDGRALFRLPSSDALAVMTASSAVCSECGSALADERAEELLTPTQVAWSMLKDASWMVSSLRAVLSALGIQETKVAVRPASAEMEAQMLADVCGEEFLFVLRDGEFNASDVRRAFDLESEVNASHLVVVATGKIQDEARVRLREHARRRSRTGGEVEVILIEGMERAAVELRHAFERVSQKALTRELFELDTSLGFDAGQMIAARFRLMQKSGPVKDLVASAAGAHAGSAREI